MVVGSAHSGGIYISFSIHFLKKGKKRNNMEAFFAKDFSSLV